MSLSIVRAKLSPRLRPPQTHKPEPDVKGFGNAMLDDVLSGVISSEAYLIAKRFTNILNFS